MIDCEEIQIILGFKEKGNDSDILKNMFDEIRNI